MKKSLVIVLAALTFSCQSRDQSTDPGAGSELEEHAPVDPTESDTTDVRPDTTTLGDEIQEP